MTHSAPVPRRVHITPLGFEDARIREPIDEWRADVVVAITHEAAETELPYLEALLADLEAEPRIDLERRSCDIFELYEAMGTITAAIDDYADDDVYVNVSAGSKITAIAGMIASMAAGATPIYARPDYGPDAERVPEEPMHDAVAETFALPTYPIDRPSNLLLSVMRYIDEEETNADEPAEVTSGRYRGPSKKELIAFARARGFEPFSRADVESEKGYYRILDSYVVEPLLEREYIALERVGRSKYVTLTESGRNASRAFGHRADAP